jgi:natural product biosynthesis luciferase-like monooxygenase protein
MPTRPALQFSLFFFAASSDGSGDIYKLLLETAKFADQNGFAAVWTPERHFQKFGGPYPNPSLTTAALATITSKIGLRAGSVVAPLWSSPLRIAEEWAVLDNLSHGRVGVSWASGWHPDDFVLAPTTYANRREDMIAKIDLVKRLWAGEKLLLPNGENREVSVGIQPRPVQRELPMWLTCQQDTSFGTAGELGYNCLTNLNYKNLIDLDRKCSLYHEGSLKGQGRRGHMTLMAHTFVGTDDDHVWRVAGTSLQQYLETRVTMDAQMYEGLVLGDAEREFLARRGVAQFLGETSLIGTSELCEQRAKRFYDAGVDEVACLIDFGVPFDEVMASLERLVAIKNALA